jgi:RNA polymerase sigma-70 factor (ECF subfamily)
MNDETFSAIFDTTRGALLAYLRRTSGDVSLAEDLLQDSYIRLLNHPPRILRSVGRDVPVPQVRKWLFTTATRLLSDHWRRERGRFWLPWATAHDEEAWTAPEPASDAPLADRTLGGHEAVAAGFARLSPRQRSLLWLATVEGFEHQELARLFGVSPASVRVLLHRARTRMGEALKALGVEGGTW